VDEQQTTNDQFPIPNAARTGLQLVIGNW
jgi:hypothetical protein